MGTPKMGPEISIYPSRYFLFLFAVGLLAIISNRELELRSEMGREEKIRDKHPATRPASRNLLDNMAPCFPFLLPNKGRTVLAIVVILSLLIYLQSTINCPSNVIWCFHKHILAEEQPHQPCFLSCLIPAVECDVFRAEWKSSGADRFPYFEKTE